MEQLRADAEQALVLGDHRAGFELADRLCRIQRASPASDLLIRSLANLGLGALSAARRDLEASRVADSHELAAARLGSALPEGSDQRVDAARTIVDHPAAGPREVRAAMALIVEANPYIPCLRAKRDDTIVRGSVAWPSGSSLRLCWRSEASSGPLTPSNSNALSEGKQYAAFALPHDPNDAVVVEAGIGGVVVSASIYAVAAPAFPAGRWVSGGEPAGWLTVIVPVYRDAEATRRCLESLRRQPGRFDVIVVNDNSPSSEIAACAEDFCRATGATYIVNTINLGFAGAVNKAILRARPGDVLLLNADVVLTEGSLERLRRGASSPDVGTATPLSNDSTSTSFPVRAAANPPLEAGQARDLDRLAFDLHGLRAVDLVTNIGFCLYIREPCLRAVGLLSPSYGRGYFEDVDFCLRAAERGFRNVVLPGIYVTHEGSRSFTASKPALVSRNAAIVDARWPDYRARLAAEYEADPLLPFRAALEEHLPLPGPLQLVVHPVRGAAVTSIPATPELRLSWERSAGTTSVRLRSPSGDVPQSLSFRLDPEGSRRCRAYLSRLEISSVMVAGAAALPLDVLSLIDDLGRPVTAQIMSRACLAYLEAIGRRGLGSPAAHNGKPAAPGRHWTVVGGDAMAAAALATSTRRRLGRRDSAPFSLPRRPEARANLGILVTHPDSAVDRLTRALLPAFNRGWSRIVVLGTCIDDLSLMSSGRVHVTGPVLESEVDELMERYRIGTILSPYRTSMFGAFDAATRGSDVPRVYFDWSEGAFEGLRGDVVLPWDVPDSEIASALARTQASAAEATL